MDAMTRPHLEVLHLLPHVRQSGNGLVNSSVDLAIEQAVSGLSVSIASQGGTYLPLLASHGVFHKELWMTQRPLSAAAAAVGHLRALIRERRPDIVHSHNHITTVLARAALLRSRVPLVATAHSEFARSTYALRVADRIIAISDANYATISRWAGADRVVVVKNGVVGSHLPRGDAVEMDHPAVLFVGGLRPRKGVDDLVSSFATVVQKVPDATLYLVGGGPDRAETERLVVEVGVAERVRFLGFQPNPRPFMSEADVLVLPSKREPFGRVLAEAREEGCAIVASDVDGIPEVLEHGRAGILVPPGDVDALAASIVGLLVQESERDRLVASGRQNLAWLSVERMERETLAVYEQALAGKR
jgi:glycosyltransferase involved in cell wall biosynthesis